MKLTEKIAYMKGYMEGLELDKATKESKVIAMMADVIEDMGAYIDDLQNQVDELTELCDLLDQRQLRDVRPLQERHDVPDRFHIIQDPQKLGLREDPAFACERHRSADVIKTTDRQRPFRLDQTDCLRRFLLPVPDIGSIKNRSKF